MKTRTVEVYVDLWSGWQDEIRPPLYFRNEPNTEPLRGESRRVKVTVVLPCVGGSESITDVVTARAEVVAT